MPGRLSSVALVVAYTTWMEDLTKRRPLAITGLASLAALAILVAVVAAILATLAPGAQARAASPADHHESSGKQIVASFTEWGIYLKETG